MSRPDPDADGPTGPATAGREHGLDLLRAVAMTLGVVIHAPLIFVKPELAVEFGIDPATLPDLPLGWGLLLGWIHIWRMPVFFVLAGFFAALTLAKRGASGFLRDRLVRIGLVMATAALAYDLLDGRVDFTLMHLWFLYVLLILSVAAAALHSLSLGSAAQAFERARWALRRDARLAWLLIPLAPLTALGRTLDGAGRIPETYAALTPGPLVYYGAWFLLGASLFAERAALARWRRAPTVIISGVTMLAGVGLHLVAVWPLNGAAPAWAAALSGLVQAGTALAACVFAIGLGGRVLTGPSRAVSALVALSYPLYLVHILPAVTLGAALAREGVPPDAAIPLTIIGTALVSALAAAVLLRLPWIGPVLGARRVPAASGPRQRPRHNDAP